MKEFKRTTDDSSTDQVREFSDLWLTGALLVGATGILLVDGVPWPIEWTLGGLFILVVPGYAIVSALFPRGPTHEPRLVVRTKGGPSWTARIALSLVVSALGVSVIGVILGWTVGLSLLSAVVTIDAVTILALWVARRRRLRLTPAECAAPLRQFRPHVSFGQTTGQSLAMLLALFVLGSTLALVAASQPPQEGHTEVTLLTERPDGTLVADEYPSELVTGESNRLHVSIENAEGEQMEYGVVLLAQDVDSSGDVTAQERVDEFELTLEDGERQVLERAISPTRTGQDIRLRTLVYEGAVPESPSVDTADHELHVWVDIVGGGGR